MKLLLGALGSGVLTIVAYVWAPYFLIATGPTFLYFIWLGIEADSKHRGAINEQVLETDARLRQELLAAHLSLFGLVDADADEKLKTSVLTLLVEAGKHLGAPEVDDQTVYEPEFFLKWNQKGLALVEEAKALLRKQPVGN